MNTAVPYVPFKTFLTTIEGCDRGIPSQFDRSLWPSYSGAIRGQLLATLRFFEFTDEAGRPTTAFREFTANREGRKALLRAALAKRYQALDGLDLTRISPKQLDDAMRTYGLTGVTHRKACSFFLQAAVWSGLPLSPILSARTRGSKGTAPPRRAEPAPKAAAGDLLSRTVKLRSGGEVTLIANVDLFAIDGEDRAFLFDLIDRLRTYGGKPGTP